MILCFFKRLAPPQNVFLKTHLRLLSPAWSPMNLFSSAEHDASLRASESFSEEHNESAHSLTDSRAGAIAYELRHAQEKLQAQDLANHDLILKLHRAEIQVQQLQKEHAPKDAEMRMLRSERSGIAQAMGKIEEDLNDTKFELANLRETSQGAEIAASERARKAETALITAKARITALEQEQEAHQLEFGRDKEACVLQEKMVHEIRAELERCKQENILLRQRKKEELVRAKGSAGIQHMDWLREVTAQEVMYGQQVCMGSRYV